MPIAPPKPCRQAGCPALVTSGYCEKHAYKQNQVRREYDRQRPSATDRGYDHRWRKARNSYLRQHPLCVTCKAEGRIVQANVVDHIKPHKGDRALFWDVSNWRAVCKHHHDSSTAAHDGGFGNPIREKD